MDAQSTWRSIATVQSVFENTATWVLPPLAESTLYSDRRPRVWSYSAFWAQDAARRRAIMYNAVFFIDLSY